MPDPHATTDRAAECAHPLCPSHCCVLNGLWWGDPEFGPAVDTLWREYVDRRHAWVEYENSVATALGRVLEAAR